MKKSDLFNKRYPTPLDQDLMKVYKQYRVIMTMIHKEWIDDVVKQRLSARGFVDLTTSRITIVKNHLGQYHPVITLKPEIADETVMLLNYYQCFFKTYKSIRTRLVDIVSVHAHDPDTILSFKPLIHSSAMLLHLLLVAHTHGMMSEEILVIIEEWAKSCYEQEDASDHPDREIINDFIRSAGLSAGFSEAFIMGGEFDEDPDSDLIKAWHVYGQKLGRLR